MRWIGTGSGGRLAMPDASGRARQSVWVGVIVAVQLLVLAATSTRYGYHRDELYFIVAGSHPAFGFPDQPPLVPLLCWLMHELAPGSLLVLRLPSALAAAATTVIAALVAREIGGRSRAQVIAASCTASSGFGLAVGHFVTTTTFDLLSTSAVCWLVIRAVSRHSGPSLLAAGVVVGAGFELKPLVALVAAVLILALGLVGPRWPLHSPWLFAGVAAAAIIGAPYVLWQARHGWPQLTVAGNIAGSAEGGRAGFLPFQLVMVSPLLVPVWIAGLLAPLRRASLRTLRFVPLSYATLAVFYLLGNGKAYYLASLYPVLLGLGAIPVAEWTRRGRRARPRPAALSVGVVVSAAVSALIALPLLPAASLQGSVVMAVNPDQGETVGWPRFVETVSRAWFTIPERGRRRTAIFTANYGEAGAIDLLGPAHGLPRAYSGHNGFGDWAQPGPTDRYALLVGYSGPPDAAPYFGRCATLATVDNAVGLANDEQGLPLMLCQPAGRWAALWPHLIHYN